MIISLLKYHIVLRGEVTWGLMPLKTMVCAC
jgi:hypothetical protein